MAETVRSIRRALDLIRVMNSGRLWTLEQITEHVNLPKTSVFRILATLEEEGYVRSVLGGRGLYQLSSRVLELSCGFSHDTALMEAARHEVIAGTRRLKWPLGLAVPEKGYMRVLFDGVPYSHYTSKTSTVGGDHAMFSTAMGLAYFSSATARERRVIIRCAARLSESLPTLHELMRQVRTIRRRGYSLRLPTATEQTAAIAVPVGRNETLIGALVCSVFGTVIDDRLISRLVPELVKIADQLIRPARIAVQ